MDLNFYQKNMELLYYKNLKNHNSNSNIQSKIDSNILKLEKSLQKTNDSITEEKNTELETRLSETEEGYFYKPWNKMSTVHKIIKIKEYVSNLDLENSAKINLLRYLKTALKEKKISKNEQVIYNITKAKIISIPKLNLNNNKFSICQ